MVDLNFYETQLDELVKGWAKELPEDAEGAAHAKAIIDALAKHICGLVYACNDSDRLMIVVIEEMLHHFVVAQSIRDCLFEDGEV